MKSYQQTFAELKKQDRAALIPFFVIGDPDFDTSLTLLKTAIDAGADVLELGIPFSDPIADGPTIQKADIRAMRSGMSLARALEFIRQIKGHKDIPIGLLMYYNLIQQYGRERFFQDFHEAGVNSVLVADLSIDDAEEVTGPARAAGLDTVFMVTPNTAPERMQRIASQTTGFIYTVSLLGVTGSRQALSGTVEGLIRQLKGLTSIPVCVGFGVSQPEHARSLAQAGADGVIIGSRLVTMIESHLNAPSAAREEIALFLRQVKAVLSHRPPKRCPSGESATQ
ncbi:MAG: tryptophan synthase subunit alpha [Planctomycetes bacterium]|jgi:tryptophan synthase alpha chain|nr:tryptophan synthase subunit alpha [Planctomycetota bacterium]